MSHPVGSESEYREGNWGNAPHRGLTRVDMERGGESRGRVRGVRMTAEQGWPCGGAGMMADRALRSPCTCEVVLCGAASSLCLRLRGELERGRGPGFRNPFMLCCGILVLHLNGSRAGRAQGVTGISLWLLVQPYFWLWERLQDCVTHAAFTPG